MSGLGESGDGNLVLTLETNELRSRSAIEIRLYSGKS